jgi:hypothetical protein
MPVEERRRVELFEKLSEAIGQEATATVFDLLPSPGADAATSADVEALGAQMDHRLAQVDQRFAQVDQRFDTFDVKLDALRNELVAVFRGELVTAVTGQTRAMIIAVVTLMLGLGGLSITLAQVG